MRPTRVRAAEFFGGAERPVLQWPAFLAEGDSWFTLGQLNLLSATNLMQQIDLPWSTCVVDAAYPGHTLQNMVEGLNDPHFDRLLRHPNWAMSWTAILLSAGGNDLIDAAAVPDRHADGSPIPVAQRLLLRPAETALQHPGLSGPARWISAQGWATLEGFLRRNLEVLVARRDSGPAQGRPLVLHTYATPTVWACGTPSAPQGWLHPALVAAGVPAAERQAVAALLFERLRDLWCAADAEHGSQPLPQVHVFDSAGRVALAPPDPTATQSSGDWANEIHPNRRGYAKLGRAFGVWLGSLLQRLY